MDDRHHQRRGDEAHRDNLNGEGQMKTNELRPEVAAHLAEETASPEERQQLQATVSLLGALPQIAPRRTFILTPELLGTAPTQRVPRRLGWLLPTRWATAVAAVCFVITLGFGQVAESGPRAAVTTPTSAVAAAVTPTPDDTRITIFGTPDFVETPVPTAVIAPAPNTTSQAGFGVDWRPAQLFFGALTALGALIGFVFPSLRRRDATTA